MNCGFRELTVTCLRLEGCGLGFAESLPGSRPAVSLSQKRLETKWTETRPPLTRPGEAWARKPARASDYAGRAARWDLQWVG